MPIPRLSRLFLRFAISTALLIAVLWATAALWIDRPESRAFAGVLAGGVLLVAALAAALVRPWRRAAVAVFVPFAFVLARWLKLVPGNDRDWQADVAKLPTATIEGSLLTVRNLRNFAYRSETEFTERWETRIYDLDALVAVDVFISFWGPTLYGHSLGYTSSRPRKGRRKSATLSPRVRFAVAEAATLAGDVARRRFSLL